jgi:hypothetical protein
MKALQWFMKHGFHEAEYQTERLDPLGIVAIYYLFVIHYADWVEILRQLQSEGYDGFFSLEPHLALSGQFQGFSGPELFRKASQSIQKLLKSIDWKYE